MKLIVLTPSKGSVCIEQRDMLLRLGARLQKAGHNLAFGDDTTNGFLDHARNVLLTMLLYQKPTWGLWLDSDTYLDPDRVISMMDRPEEIIAWNYPIRLPWDPLYPPENRIAVTQATAHQRRRWTGGVKCAGLYPVRSADGILVEMRQIGFGAVLMRPSVAEALVQSCGLSSPDWQSRRVIRAFDLLDAQYRFGEDYAFCKRWTKQGAGFWCDPAPYVTNGATGGCFQKEIDRADELRARIGPIALF